MACGCLHVEMVHLLVLHGADWNVEDCVNMTPLQYVLAMEPSHERSQVLSECIECLMIQLTQRQIFGIPIISNKRI